jgi:hypothetical protein
MYLLVKIASAWIITSKKMNEFSIISLGFEKIINKYQNLLNHDLFYKSNKKDIYIYI